MCFIKSYTINSLKFCCLITFLLLILQITMSEWELKRLHKKIIELTKDFSFHDFLECRKERNWEKFDMLNPSQKLIYRIKEIKEYKNGYSSDEEEQEE